MEKYKFDTIIKRLHISKISALHYIKLLGRSLLFLMAVAGYIVGKIEHREGLLASFGKNTAFLTAVWLIFVGEMILRLLPSQYESMGCQKKFKRNYQPTARQADPSSIRNRGIVATAVVWIAANAVIGGLYLVGILDAGMMLIVSLAYSVCDMICILFFCPFQTWFMKNRCCGTCRIYNWDYAMMFTPMIFIRSFYTWSLLAVAVIVLLEWEITYKRHKEWFHEATNTNLSCANCSEKLCHHKKQLKRFWAKNRHLVFPQATKVEERERR